VSDTGSGIEPADIEHVFEPFFTTKQKARGTGLGLSMVYGFIKQSHGHIALYSEPGEGTTVKLYLPRALGGEVEARHEVATARLQGGDAAILLVEDDDLVRRYTRDLLVSLGYEVKVADSGPEALRVLETEEPFELLLTDVVMPGGMSGRDVAQAAASMRPGMAILFMSGYTEDAIVHHGRLDPGVRLLSKPFRRRDLAQKVSDALAQSRRENQ
jgi:CheY-like chemotaxis protein